MRSRPLTRTAQLLASAAVALVVALAVVLAVPATAARTTAKDVPAIPDLHLVTLSGPGTTGGTDGPARLLARQDAVLASIGDPEPTYRWTTALNGFAVSLGPDQLAALESDPRVALVEPNAVVPMAAGAVPSTALVAPDRRLRGGAGVVIGFVDSGIDPDSPVFSAVPGLGRGNSDYSGRCAPGEGWPATTCNRKLVGSTWFVEGFGEERLRSSESLSARDVVGHGTQVASVAAGNAGVTVRIDDRNLGDFGGVAPQARVAAYKACWAAPDPDDDGCATADLVSAIDQATADRVDVLNLAVAGPDRTDTVARALLGAAEGDVVAVAAAGNAGDAAYAAHGSPWVTTVGALRGRTSRGSVTAVGGPTLVGASRVRRRVGPLPAVLAVDAAAPGATRRQAAECHPGSLDAAAVAGHAVVCERGGIGRIDKSAALAQVDAVAMVLVNTRRNTVEDDIHSVPTVHLSVDQARTLRRWLADRARPRLRLTPQPGAGTEAVVAPSSSAGDPRGAVLKPDVVAPGAGVLGASPAADGHGWELFSGTSAATAHASGTAALLRAEHPGWPATRIRSALATTARGVPGASALRQGSGRVRTSPVRVGLVLDVDARAYRRVLEGDSPGSLNTPSLLLSGGRTTATRQVTHMGERAEYFSVRVAGFTEHRVQVTPLALRLDPGESATFRVTVTGPGGPSGLDDGSLTWRGARGSRTRIPVAIGR